jgi:fumarylacetoacetate (FAA) hydrolase
VPRGVTPNRLARHPPPRPRQRRLASQLIPAELAKGFGFLQSKPASALSPVLVTPDELGDRWKNGKLHGRSKWI